MQTIMPSINPLSIKKVGLPVNRVARSYPRPGSSPAVHPDNLGEGQVRRVATAKTYLDASDAIREVLYGLTIIALLAILALSLGWATQVQRGLVESNAHAMRRVPTVSLMVASHPGKKAPAIHQTVHQ